ncbi:MAG TPA: Gfo/Idh/MocA family oxidoreductase [Fimbriimonadaceae bacterium]|nr:Gfo/Idh/MocA family oxidoreductase [Fimbriimonadaceae bacterium]
MSLRALIVGAGSMGRAWARILTANDRVDLVGWSDRSIDIVDAACAETGIDVPGRYDRFDSALACRPDFVVDVTVPESHCEVTLQALEAGLPVLGEKPMASTMAEARRMVEASERAGKLYMVSQSRRYNAGLCALRRASRDRLGDLGILNADFYLGPHFGGFRDEMGSPLLLDMAIHTFDAARFLSGADPISVYSEEFNPSWSWYRGNACATAIFEMTGGLRFTYRGSWCAEGLMTSWESEWRLTGSKGTATWNGTSAPRMEVVSGPDGFFSKTAPVEVEVDPVAEGIAGSLNEFLWALETGETPNGACQDNIKSLAMVFGAIESARQGRRISIREILEG